MSDVDEYDLVDKRPLKLATSKHKSKKRIKEPSNLAGLETAPDEVDVLKVITPAMTEAEAKFKSKQEEIAQERILKKAQKTHKQRVEEFNKHLDSLSEHYDIPKVSWTK